MRQEILTGALKPNHRHAGLHLKEIDKRILALQRKDQRIAFFNQSTVRIDEIHRSADLYLAATDMVSHG